MDVDWELMVLEDNVIVSKFDPSEKQLNGQR